MAKTISVPLQDHLEEEATSLATCWRITRRDDEEFFFTDHDVALLVDGNLYKADSGYKRTAVANDSSLSVDNLDIEGVFDNEEITEEDLRAGKFDYAQIRIFIVNWEDLSQGILRIRSGRMGEVGLTEQGVFKAELRGLTQQLSQRIGEVYQPECRADLGDDRCTIPIDPDERLDSHAYFVGDTIRVRTANQGGTLPSTTKFLTSMDTTGVDKVTTNTPTFGSSATIQSSVTKFGAGALSCAPVDANDLNCLVEWSDNASYDITNDDFCIEGWVRFNSDPAGWLETIFAHQDNTVDVRGWAIERSAGGFLQAVFSIDDPDGLPVEAVSSSFAFNTGQFYHIAVSREGGNLRLFIDGDLKMTNTTLGTTALFDSSANLTMGGRKINAGNFRPLDGYTDEWQITVGIPVYTSNFTPPNEPFQGISNTLPADTQFLVHLNDDTKDERTTNYGALGTNAQLQGAEVKFGSGALEISPASGSDDEAKATWPSNSAYNISGQSFAIEGQIQRRSVGSSFQYMMSRGSTVTSDGWSVRIDQFNGEARFFAETTAGFVSLSSTTQLALDQWYHVAVTYDISDDTYRIFIDGIEEDSVVDANAIVDATTDDLWLGAYNFSVFRRSLDGFLDECRITVGDPVYTSDFDPPTTEFSGGEDFNDQRDFENRYYLCTEAGTSDATQPIYDTTIGNSTTDGTSIFLAENAWMRNGVVDTVVDRTNFTLTSDFDEVRAVDDWFNGGALQFEDGSNEGRSIEIRDWVQSTRTITLFLPTAFTIEPGTLVRLYPGCDKLSSTCKDQFDNIINFRGFAHVPGQDEYVSYPDAKTA